MNSKYRSVSLFKKRSQNNTCCIEGQGNVGPPGPPGRPGTPGTPATSMTFSTTGSTPSTSYKGLSNIYFDEKTFQIDPNDVSGIIISSGLNVGVDMNPLPLTYGHINTLLFDSNSGFNIIQHENKSITIGSNGSVVPIGAGPPPDISFGTTNSTSKYIYIPWEYPEQIIMGDAYLPYINSFSAYYTINDTSKNIILNGTGTDYIKGPPSTSNQSQTYITGIILTNVKSDDLEPISLAPGTSGIHKYVSFPTNPVPPRWCYIYYDASLHMFLGDASGSINAKYINYSGDSRYCSANFSAFQSAGKPSPTGIPSALYKNIDAVGLNYDISSGSWPTIIDGNALPGDPVDYALNNFKYILTGISYSHRYSSLLPDSMNISPPASTSSQISVSLIPDALYSLTEQVNNTSANTLYSEASDSYTINTRSLNPPIFLSSLTPTQASIYSPTGSRLMRSVLGKNTTTPYQVIHSLATCTIDISAAPVHTLATRGNSGTEKLLDISCNVYQGAAVVAQGPIVSYKGFGTIPTTGTATSNISFTTAISATDSYTTANFTGYYQTTAVNHVQIGTSSTAFTSSPNMYTIKVSMQQFGISGNNDPDPSANALIQYNYYCDPYAIQPTIDLPTFKLTTGATYTMICGVYILTGTTTIDISANVNNLGKYFYYDSNGTNNLLTWNLWGNTTYVETTLANTNVSGDTLSSSTCFSSTLNNVALPANFTTDISAGVNRVINCAGLVAGPSINTSSGKGIYDAPSLVAYNANSTAPNVTSPNNGISGYRISSGTSSERITTLGAGVASEVSYNNASIINNYELQLFSGKYATKGSTPTTKGYLDYTLYNGYSESTKHNTSNYVGINSSGYRYATFSWAVPCQSPVTIQYSKILFSMTGVTTSNGAATTIYTPNTCPCITASAGLTGAKPILMFYRTQNASDASNSINANTGNTYWINAFSNILDPAVVNGTSVITSGTQVNAAAAYNTDPNTQVNTTTGNINGDNASIDNTYSNGTFNVNVNLIPTLTSRLLGPNYYIYCRIGLPMEGSIGFGNITATFS